MWAGSPRSPTTATATIGRTKRFCRRSLRRRRSGVCLNKPKPLVFFGCVHVGAKTADMDLAHAYVDFVRQHDGFALLLADNHECAVPRKAHMMFEQNLTPQEQLDYSVELFKPIKRNIKGGVTGNHAWRAYHDSGLEMDKEMFERLGILQHYYGFQGYVEIPLGKQRYRVMFAHGNNIGRNVFANCERLEAIQPNADIYAASHAHVLATMPKQHREFRDGRSAVRDLHYVSTGSLLDYPLYAGQALYQPQPKGFAFAWIYPDEYRVDVDVTGRIPGYASKLLPKLPDAPTKFTQSVEWKCSRCGGTEALKNGLEESGRQKYRCANCHRKADRMAA